MRARRSPPHEQAFLQSNPLSVKFCRFTVAYLAWVVGEQRCHNELSATAIWPDGGGLGATIRSRPCQLTPYQKALYRKVPYARAKRFTWQASRTGSGTVASHPRSRSRRSPNKSKTGLIGCNEGASPSDSARPAHTPSVGRRNHMQHALAKHVGESLTPAAARPTTAQNSRPSAVGWPRYGH